MTNQDPKSTGVQPYPVVAQFMFIGSLDIFRMVWFAIERGPRRGGSRLQESFSLAESHCFQYFVPGKGECQIVDQRKNIGAEKTNGLGKD